MTKKFVPYELSLKKEFIPRDRAIKLKSLGFNEPCLLIE
jgi:hypothetical protein